MTKVTGLILGVLVPVVALIGVASAQQDDRDKVPSFVAAEKINYASTKDVGKWVYFVSNDPHMAVFNVDGNTAKVEYTIPQGGKFVVVSTDLKYTSDDATGFYFMFETVGMPGAPVWFLPKSKRAYVYSMPSGVQSPVITAYGLSVRYAPK